MRFPTIVELKSIPSKFLVWFWFQVRLLRVGAKRGNPIFVGIGSTKLFLAAVCMLAFMPQKTDDAWSWRMWSFLVAPSNEIGDTLAGIAGTLAFLWIIVTVMLQGKELSAQREELKLTRKVMIEQKLAAEDMAKAMSEQASMYKGERRERNEDRADRLLNEKLRSLVITISELHRNGLVWNFSNAIFDDEFGSTGQVISHTIGETGDEGLTVDEAISNIRRRLLNLYDSLWESVDTAIDWRLPEKSEHISDLLIRIQSILEIRETLSPSQQERLDRMRLRVVISELQKIDGTAEFWERAAEK